MELYSSNKNLLMFNGQLKYYKKTLSYWKEFSEKNDCLVCFISQPKISYKNGDDEVVDKLYLRKYFQNFFFLDVTDNIHRILLKQIDVIYKSIQNFNQNFNSTHDLENYSGTSYLIRCLYRQLSTLYMIDHVLNVDSLHKFDKILYARIDFLLYDGGSHFVFQNGGLYDPQDDGCLSNDDGSYSVSKYCTVPDIRSTHCFSISDYMFWGSFKVIELYLRGYVRNFYRYGWPDQKVISSVEAQSNQFRRHLNKTLSEDEQLWDIFDFPNNLFSYNFFSSPKYSNLKVRLWRVKTKSQLDSIISSPSLKINTETISVIHQYSLLSDHCESLKDGTRLDGDFNTTFLSCSNEDLEIFQDIVRKNNIIIKLNMGCYLLEHKSIEYPNVNQTRFENSCKFMLYLFELKKINPNTMFIIHTIDLHRMNWKLFFYLVKLLSMKYVFSMYCPWFYRQIMNNHEKLDYKSIKDISIYQQNYPLSFQMAFYPRYLWKTRGILYSLCKQLNIQPSSIFDQPKEIDLLLYGCLNPKINPDYVSKSYLEKEDYVNFDLYYEFRRRIHDLLVKSEVMKNYKIHIIPWVSKHSEHGVYNEDLFELISKSKFVISTSANVQYLVRKYYEIPMSGSIMMGNIPDYAPSVMKDNMILLKMSMSDEELISIVSNSIDCYEEHRSKQNLGRILQQVSSVYDIENHFIRDFINWKETHFKTSSLYTFMKLLTYPDVNELPLTYQNDY